MGGAQAPFGQPQSKSGSSASFASLSGGLYGAGQGTGGHTSHAHGPVRKKARLG